MSDPKIAVKYAYAVRKRLPDAEDVIAADPEAAANYARSVLEGRWPRAETVILEKSKLHEACYYVRTCFPKAVRCVQLEERIMRELRDAQTREQRESILADAIRYSTDVIQGRWLEMEPHFAVSEQGGHYQREVERIGGKFERQWWCKHAPVADYEIEVAIAKAEKGQPLDASDVDVFYRLDGPGGMPAAAARFAHHWNRGDLHWLEQFLSHGPGFNDSSKKAFFALQRKKVPGSIKAIVEGIDSWAGVHPDERTLINRHKEVLSRLRLASKERERQGESASKTEVRFTPAEADGNQVLTNMKDLIHSHWDAGWNRLMEGPKRGVARTFHLVESPPGNRSLEMKGDGLSYCRALVAEAEARAAYEKTLPTERTPDASYYHVRALRIAVPELMPVIATDARLAVACARFVVKGRWPEVEAIIASSDEQAAAYEKAMSAWSAELPADWRAKALGQVEEEWGIPCDEESTPVIKP